MITEAQATEAMAAALALQGNTPTVAPSPKAIETDSTSQDTPITPPHTPNGQDAIIWAAPETSAGYQLHHGQIPEGAEVSREFEMTNREAMLHAGIPQSIGGQLARMWHHAMLSELPTDAQLELGKRAALATLTKQWGDATHDNLQLAKSVVSKMAEVQPAVWKMLEVSGMGNDPWVISTLANMARAKGGRRD